MEWRVDLWFAQVPGAVSRLLRFMLQRQPEPDLERARRQMWHRARITLAVGVLGVSLPIILSYL